MVTKKQPGSFAMELALWLMFIIPGILYSVWRGSSERYVCPRCRGERMMPC